MKKQDIETHRDGYGPSHPAVNVKCRNFIGTGKVQDRFKCCQATAEKALEYAWQSSVESFWESAKEIGAEVFGKSASIYSEGRSGGWVVVHNLGDIESWDAIAVSRWSRFAKRIEAERDWVTSESYVFDMIEANDWAQADALLDDEEAETAEVAEWNARDVVTV